MGLDQYLRAKTNSIQHKSSRGACNGLFSIAPLGQRNYRNRILA